MDAGSTGNAKTYAGPEIVVTEALRATVERVRAVARTETAARHAQDDATAWVAEMRQAVREADRTDAGVREYAALVERVLLRYEGPGKGGPAPDGLFEEIMAWMTAYGEAQRAQRAQRAQQETER